MLFQLLLRSVVRKGSLKLITADGRVRVYGDGSLPHVSVRLHDKKLEWSLGLRPDLKIGEAYMEGLLTIEEGDLYDFLYLLVSNYKETGDRSPFHWIEHISPYFAWLEGVNSLVRARRNVAFHYDMPDLLYSFFLDSDRQYSCGYFSEMYNSLEQAQFDKKRHIASKLLLNRAGLRVLDIGSGWGGLGLYLARETGCRVNGVTLSVNQHKISQERAKEAGLERHCQFNLQDYRKEEGVYDRIVSVGMFEHVGKKNYGEFFAQIKRLLDDDGVCLLHSIARFNGPKPVSAFIRKHIFPGSYLPVLSDVLSCVEKSGLITTDIEILRLHYAETLKRWRERLQQHQDEIVKLFGDELYRKWLFYFTGSEVGFRVGNLMVFQIQLSKKLDAVPYTRDYMINWEQAYAPERYPLDRHLEDIIAASSAQKRA